MSWTYGDDFEYAASRLNDTYVKHMGLVVHVEEITHEGIAVIQTDKGVAQVLAKELDLSSITLGYFLIDRFPHYLERIPARKYRQGLSQGVLSALNLRGQAVNCRLTLRDLNAREFSKGFILTPSWMVWEGKLYHEGVHVGAGLKLLPRYQYLKESLDEASK
jgi:hypothetical protein